MARSANDLIVGIGADLKALERELKKAGALANNAVNDIEDRFARANPRLGTAWAVGIGTALGNIAAGAVSGFIELVKKANDDLIKLGETAERTGIGLAQLDRFVEMGRSAGVKDMNAQLVVMDNLLREGATEANNLTRFFEQQGIKLRDNNGQLINAQEAMIRMADAFKNADPFSREKMADYLGLSKEVVAVLMQGSDVLREQSGHVRTTDGEMGNSVKTAQEIKQRWEEVSTELITALQPALLGALEIVSKIAAGINTTVEGLKQAKGLFEILAGGGPKGYTSNEDGTPYLGPNAVTPPVSTVRTGGNPPPVWKAPPKPSSGGGSETARRDAVESYISSLQRQIDLQRIEFEMQGKNNVERQTAIALANAEAAARGRGTELTAEEIEKVKQLAAERGGLMDKMREMQALYSAANFAGDQLLDVFDAAIDKSRSLEDAIQGVVKALIKAALQAAILGQGPLAGLMGMSGTGGAPGGLVGGIISGFRATGGPVQSGKTYVVGENGPELVRFGKNGQVVPNSLVARDGAGNGGGVSIHVENHGADVQTQTTQGPDGVRLIRMIVRSEIASDIGGNGDIAKLIQGRYGLNRARGR